MYMKNITHAFSGRVYKRRLATVCDIAHEPYRNTGRDKKFSADKIFKRFSVATSR